jgi:hypothetical protein
MKYYGDIPVEHLEIVRELIVLERWFHDHGDTVPSLLAAKGFVSMSHDYFSMFMDEEGVRLLTKAENCHKGYFKGPIYEHANKDGAYDFLVESLKNTSGIKLMRSFGFDT